MQKSDVLALNHRHHWKRKSRPIVHTYATYSALHAAKAYLFQAWFSVTAGAAAPADGHP